MRSLLIVVVHAAVIAVLFQIELPLERAYHSFLRGADKYSTIASGDYRGEPGMEARIRISTNGAVQREQSFAVVSGDKFQYQHARKKHRSRAEKFLIHSIANDFWIFFEQLGLFWWALMGCIVIWAYDPARRRFTLVFLVAMAVTSSLVTVLKATTGKIRPEPFFNGEYPAGFLPFLKGWTVDAPVCFPSGHSTFVFMAATFFALLYPRIGWMLYTAAVFTALSRVLTESHWLSDVYTGALLGWGSMRLLHWLFTRYSSALLARLPQPLKTALGV